jgi:integrase
MARAQEKLSDAKVRSNSLVPGYLSDGGGLYLQVGPTGSKAWVFRYQRNKKRREMGLGPTHAVSLSRARKKAAELRGLIADGRDPFMEKRAALADERGTMMFREAANLFIKAHKAGWRNEKHQNQWQNTLDAYAHPLLGDLPVAAVDTAHVLKVLEPIWTTKTETAKRVRQRIEAILDYATARRYRSGENPARWKGHLDKLMAKPTKVRRVQHHAALPYDDIPAFMTELADQPGVAAKALAFTILTAARTGEIIGAKWNEIDGTVWTIPGERMKAGREHRVPLTPAATAILVEMRAKSTGTDDDVQKAPDGDFIFPGGRAGKPLSNMAMAAILKRMDRDDITVHGFRSCLRDWAGERSNFPREVIEQALAHVVAKGAEAAYARGDLFEKRRRLMSAWERFCTTPPAKGDVVAIARPA